MVKNISSTSNAKKDSNGRGSTESTADQAANVCQQRCHFYRSGSGARLQDVQRKTTTIHAGTGFKFLFVCKLKTETHASVEGKNWCKVQPMGVNKLNKIMKDMTQAAGIPGKTNDSGRKPLVQKLQESGVPPNQIIQITGHKNLQSVNNYSSLREQQMESI